MHAQPAAPRGTAISQAAARIAFRYVDDAICLTALPLADGRLIEVVTDPDCVSSEWVLSRDGVAEQHSDAGYGTAALALRDALIVALGLPDNVAALQHRHEHGRAYDWSDVAAAFKSAKDAGMAPIGSRSAS